MGSMHVGLEELENGDERMAAFYAERARGIVNMMVGDRPEVLDVDNVIVCAVQDPQHTLHQQLEYLRLNSHLIGGADKVLGLDAKRAINQGTRLAGTI